MSTVALALKELVDLRPDDLRKVLDKHFPSATPLARQESAVVSTGVLDLDRILPKGGFPKGRLTVWSPLGGATTLLRSAALSTVTGGERVAWIDAHGTIAGACWVNGPILIRPGSRAHALRSAGTLLRSGGFSLVVLVGADPVGNENVKLARAAHEGNCAFVAVASNAAMAALRLSSFLNVESYSWKKGPSGEPAIPEYVSIHVSALSLGWKKEADIRVPVWDVEARLSLESGLRDRRGGALSKSVRSGASYPLDIA